MYAGRVLDKQSICTHALVIRFPSIEVLLAYYKSDAHANIAARIAPFLHVNTTQTNIFYRWSYFIFAITPKQKRAVFALSITLMYCVVGCESIF